jgi:ArsR family transcriptional regulator, virulence genes transcriptional regulator
MKDLIRIQADICKTFANPSRLHIIKLLCKREMNAADLIKEVKISKANLSQHMSMLTGKGIVTSHKKGVNVYYALSDKKISQACSLMQEVAVGTINRRNSVLDSLKNSKK